MRDAPGYQVSPSREVGRESCRARAHVIGDDPEGVHAAEAVAVVAQVAVVVLAARDHRGAQQHRHTQGRSPRRLLPSPCQWWAMEKLLRGALACQHLCVPVHSCAPSRASVEPDVPGAVTLHLNSRKKRRSSPYTARAHLSTANMPSNASSSMPRRAINVC